MEDNKEMSELGDSDNDLFLADNSENNSNYSNDDKDPDDSDSQNKKYLFPEDEDIQTRLPGPKCLYKNNEIMGPYPEDMSLNCEDLGPNMQFLNLDD